MKALFSFNTFQNSALVSREYYKLLKQTRILVQNKLNKVRMRKKKEFWNSKIMSSNTYTQLAFPIG